MEQVALRQPLGHRPGPQRGQRRVDVEHGLLGQDHHWPRSDTAGLVGLTQVGHVLAHLIQRDAGEDRVAQKRLEFAKSHGIIFDGVGAEALVGSFHSRPSGQFGTFSDKFGRIV